MKLYIAKIASILLGAEEPDIASLNFYRSKGDLFYEFSATGAVSADQKFTFSHAMEMQKQIALQIFFRSYLMRKTTLNCSLREIQNRRQGI